MDIESASSASVMVPVWLPPSDYFQDKTSYSSQGGRSEPVCDFSIQDGCSHMKANLLAGGFELHMNVLNSRMAHVDAHAQGSSQHAAESAHNLGTSLHYMNAVLEATPGVVLKDESEEKARLEVSKALPRLRAQRQRLSRSRRTTRRVRLQQCTELIIDKLERFTMGGHEAAKTLGWSKGGTLLCGGPQADPSKIEKVLLDNSVQQSVLPMTARSAAFDQLVGALLESPLFRRKLACVYVSCPYLDQQGVPDEFKAVVELAELVEGMAAQNYDTPSPGFKDERTQAEQYYSAIEKVVAKICKAKRAKAFEKCSLNKLAWSLLFS